MNAVTNLERQILELHSSLGLRTTLERAAKLGELLTAVKEALPYGEFMTWTRRLPFTHRTATTYIKVFAHAGEWKTTSNLTVDQFVRLIRRATRHRPRTPPSHTAPVTADAAVHHADCRRFDWPGVAQCICADPPWVESWPYDWLPEFCQQHLADGGLALVQCGVMDLADRLARLTRSGVLTYSWTLAMVYDDMRSMKPVQGLAPAWRPLLMLTKGKRPVPRGAVTCDVFTVRSHHSGVKIKELHPWQQPLAPWQHWLSKLVAKGSTIFVPFVGSGTEMIAATKAGCLAIGTEIDSGTFRTARQRCRDEATPQPKT